MCGIAGVIRWSRENRDLARQLETMSSAISHRGPDDEGYLLAAPCLESRGENRKAHVIESRKLNGVCLGLAHRRLSILDLSAHGHQPMNRRKGGPWIAYNGETYNFRELRHELATQGATFTTNTDTEVLLAAYEKWGVDFISRCHGMFALALFDPERGELLLYRDRAGIKPLYFHEDDKGVSFCSELKGLLAANTFARHADPAAIRAYLEFQVVHHRPETFVRNVRELPPGHMMRIDLRNRKTTIRPWYDLVQGVERRRRELPERLSDQVAFVREQFIDTVRGHLISDVRVGSCLSGGLDSSSIVCVATMLKRQQAGESDSLGDRITTFSSCHEDVRYDEQQYIDLVTKSCNARAIKIFSRPEELAGRLDELIWHQDEPFTSASIFAQFLLMEAARKEGVTVLLDGQGGDEIFAGYRKFFFFYMRDLLRGRKLGTLARELFGAFVRGDGDLFDLRAMRRYLPGPLRRSFRSIGRFLHQEALGEAGLQGFQGASSIVERQILDVKHYSLPALLHYEDRNSMAFGIEARVPFLDHRMIETGIALPIEAKIRGGVAKYALREAMRGIVPDKILDRRTKMGFVTPEREWMLGALRPLMEDMLAKPQAVTAELVNMEAIARQYRLFVEGRRSALLPREFFRLLCLDRWVALFNITDI